MMGISQLSFLFSIGILNVLFCFFLGAVAPTIVTVNLLFTLSACIEYWVMSFGHMRNLIVILLLFSSHVVRLPVAWGHVIIDSSYTDRINPFININVNNYFRYIPNAKKIEYALSSQANKRKTFAILINRESWSFSFVVKMLANNEILSIIAWHLLCWMRWMHHFL